MLNIHSSHCTQNCIFWYFLAAKTLFLRPKIVQNLLIFVYFFRPKNSTVDSRKTSMTQEWLVVESSPTTGWIAVLMLYWLVCNIRSHFNERVRSEKMFLETIIKYLGLTLVFMWNSGIQEKFNNLFFKSFLLVLTKFLLWQEDWTLGYNSKKIKHFPYIS